MDSALKMMDFVFKLMNFARGSQESLVVLGHSHSAILPLASLLLSRALAVRYVWMMSALYIHAGA